MQRTEVNSGQVKSIGYSEAERTLEVEFTSNAVYVYKDVPPGVYEEFMRAESKGRFFGLFVRPCYEYERLHREGCGKYGDCHIPLCSCFCHALTKSSRKVPNPDLEKDLRKSIKQAKKRKAGQ